MLNAFRRRTPRSEDDARAAVTPRDVAREDAPAAEDRVTPNEPAPVAHARGHLDRLDDGLLTGWFAAPDDTALDKPVTVWVGDRAVARVERCDFREDLARAGIAKGFASFSADVSTALLDVDASLDIALSIGPEDSPHVFVRRTFTLADHRPANPNPYLRPENASGVEGWSLAHEASRGLLVDDFPLPRELAQYASRYTRLALTDLHGGDGEIRLACPLALEGPLDGDLSVVLLVRADRPMTLSCAVATKHAQASRIEIEVGCGWSLLTRPLDGSAALGEPTAGEANLTLAFTHRGRGFLDIGLCYVARQPSFRFLNRTMRGLPNRPDEDVAAAPTSYLRNGDFEHWSRGFRFDALRDSQELADGWFLQGRKDQMHHVKVAMDSAMRRVPGNDPDLSPSFGLRVVTGGFEGAMRLVAGVDRRVLDRTSATLRLSLHALGSTRLSSVRRVALILRGDDGESTARTLAGKTRVRGHSRIELTLNEGDMIAVRRACKGKRVADSSRAAAPSLSLPRLLVAIDFDRDADVFIESIELEGADLPRTAATIPEPDATAPVGFEDPNVSSQLTLVAGLEGWRDGARCDDASLVASKDANGPERDDDVAFVAPDVLRPHAGYPDVDIVVPIYNALESVQACVQSVIEQTTVPYTLVLIDDGSEPDTHAWLERVAARYPNVVLVTNERNLGYTRTVNRGLKLSNADYVCVLNSDCIVTPDWLPLMVDCATQQDKAGMVGPLSNAASYQSVPKIRDGSGAWCFNPLSVTESPASMAARVREASVAGWPAVRVLNGFCQLIDRRAIEAIGYLDEKAFPRGFGEENDYCARLVDAGFTLHVVDDAYVFHSKSQSFGHDQRKALSKEGSAALKLKHPTLDWNEITREVEFSAPIAHLRQQLAA